MARKEKYSTDKLYRTTPANARLVKVGLMIANELHAIHSALLELKEKK